MNNKPYGWHCFIGKGKEEQDFLFINGKGASKPDASWDKVIPLYTHPVKELTDEEIIEIGLLTTDPRFSHIESPLLLEFARAILLKTQK